jgi:hypothetical protein
LRLCVQKGGLVYNISQRCERSTSGSIKFLPLIR